MGVAAAQGAPKVSDSQAKEIGDQFEALMLQRVYEEMERSQRLLNAGDDNPFAPSNAEMIFRSMLTSELQKGLARNRPLGVGRLVERQLKGEGGIGSHALVESKLGSPGRATEPQGAHQEGEEHGRHEDPK